MKEHYATGAGDKCFNQYISAVEGKQWMQMDVCRPGDVGEGEGGHADWRPVGMET